MIDDPLSAEKTENIRSFLSPSSGKKGGESRNHGFGSMNSMKVLCVNDLN